MTLLPPSFLDNVVTIGEKSLDGKTKWIATGFLYGHLIKTQDDSTLYIIFLVTNKHVYLNKNQIVVRLNNKGLKDSKEFTIELINEKGKSIVLTHNEPDVDCALIHLLAPKLDELGINISAFLNDKNTANISMMNESGLSEGDSIFVLGYPLGIVDPTRNLALVRGGIISRIRDLYSGDTKVFIIDSSIFPGNSGGPVLIKPEATSIYGTKPHNQSKLIGLVSSYIPYKDIAVSNQTGQPLLVLQENSGLATVVPVDYIEQIIDKYVKESSL